ncbi:MAG: plsX [Bacteroidetes bacterium]|jgi:glycerol-3-phosphate acyltransferase PlsX|nr:plsX [Bacteroidota bacterium]
MGGDYAPAAVVTGALEAVREAQGRFSVILVGRKEKILEEIGKNGDLAGHEMVREHYSIEPADDVIEMHDSPTAALKSKQNSSIGVGLRLQRDKKADAFVSAGNTGAVLSASTLILGRLKRVGRPTIGALIPTVKSPCLLVDAGANVDCRAKHLLEFALMGSIYVSSMLGKTDPVVGLLNIGEEESKGNTATVEAFGLLKQSKLNFAGNVEGRDLLKGTVDVIVCDGFVGNVLLKFGESVPSFFKAKVSRLAEQSIRQKLIALLARGTLRGVMKELDYQEYGGVPLLGVDGVSVIGHGRSTPKAIKNMIFRAEETAVRQVSSRIAQAILQLPE